LDNEEDVGDFGEETVGRRRTLVDKKVLDGLEEFHHGVE
jgi:hypothetical protein